MLCARPTTGAGLLTKQQGDYTMADSMSVSEDLIKTKAELNKVKAELSEVTVHLINRKAEITKLKTEIAKTKADFIEAMDWTERELIAGTLSAPEVDDLQQLLDHAQLSAEGNDSAIDAKVDRLQRVFNLVKPPKPH
jgi:hypothetical protein